MYTIKKGDNLYRIALSHGTTVSELRKLNNLKGNLIISGRTLSIPSKKFHKQAKKMLAKRKPIDTYIPATSCKADENTKSVGRLRSVSVEKRDRLRTVAQLHNLTLKQFRQINVFNKHFPKYMTNRRGLTEFTSDGKAFVPKEWADTKGNLCQLTRRKNNR